MRNDAKAESRAMSKPKKGPPDMLDGSGEAKDRVSFSLDGVDYYIALTRKNARRFRELLHPYVEHGVRVASRRRPAASTGPQNSDIRRWARSEGHEVSARGRISQEIRNEYARAHNLPLN